MNIETRKQLLSRRDFAHSGVTITEDAWQHRQAVMTAELIADLPTLRRLRASKLEFAYQFDESRLQVLVYLAEIPQLNLLFGSRLDAQGDIYLQDLEHILRDQQDLTESYEHAQKSTVDPAEDARTQSLRRRMVDSQKAGYVHIHSTTNGEVHRLDSIPKFLPNSRQFEIQAKVIGLRIDDVDIVPCSNVQFGPGHPPILYGGTKILAHRNHTCRNVAVGTLLQTAMDLKDVILLEVVVEHSWVDGRPNRITLINVPSAFLRGA